MNKGRWPCICMIICMLGSACEMAEEKGGNVQVKTLNLTMYSHEKPESQIDLLFIHHSCGGALLADKGEKTGELDSFRIYESHPNGGGLRRLLEENNYRVHEASYGSLVGEDTDVCHWNTKFRDHMDRILRTKQQNRCFEGEQRNKIILFKSCYPNSWIISDGEQPGNPDACERTSSNYKAAYNALLPYFAANPDTLFVALTAPPMAKPRLSTKDRIKEICKTALGRPDTTEIIGRRVRTFNNWLMDIENGWLKEYDQLNVVVFDLYDVLTDYGKSEWSMYPTRGGVDSHPSSEGNIKVANELVLFVNRVVARMECNERAGH